MRQLAASSLLISVLLVVGAGVGPPVAGAESDPRFFGTYCGSHAVEVVVKVKGPTGLVTWRTVRRTIEVSVVATAEYEESFPDDFVLGSGTLTVDDEDVSFVFSGRVTDRGYLQGAGRIPGESPVGASARLAADGETLWVSAEGHRARLSKGECDNAQPSVTVEAPAGREFLWGEPIDFRGTVSDAEDASFPEERLIWRSDRQGSLGTGTRMREHLLRPGRHTITFMAIDSGGRIGRDSIELNIANNPPTRPRILQPEDGATYYVGQEIPFRGWAQDRESGDLRGEALRWSSSLDGEIGTGELFTLRRLSRRTGDHRITLTATDGTETSSSSVDIRVLPRPPENMPPTVQIDSPRHRTGVGSDECLVFVARASDLEDGPLEGASVVWTDSWRDGAASRSRAGTFTGSRLELCGWSTTGHDTWHTIRVTATDSDGLTATDEIRIYVIPGGLI